MYTEVVEKKFQALRQKKDVCILGIESSCDETAASVVQNGRRILSNVISSQIDIHKKFGGVVPEIASRNHTMAICGVIDEALKSAGIGFEDLDAIAVTYGAGLVGALLVGVSAAKALSWAHAIPLIGVNHIQGHICANFLEYPHLQPPFTALVASGGHTSIVRVEDYCRYTLKGSTVDDAIGEAFDKVARLLGLGYPGGPAVDALSKLGQANIEFYKTKKRADASGNLSYSGLKTAVVNYVHNARQKGEEIPINDVCASFTKCAVDLLVETVLKLARAEGHKTIVMAGGVAANSYLRQRMKDEGERAGFEVYYPSLILCTDNAAMIAARGYYSAMTGENLADLTLNAMPSLRLTRDEG